MLGIVSPRSLGVNRMIALAVIFTIAIYATFIAFAFARARQPRAQQRAPGSDSDSERDGGGQQHHGSKQ
ncbi:hypothetical protein [Sphingomonas sp. 10B4]|uniref:hypothetical protein n=2 Tax=Sphingomonas sp. 10B4 TaxID=3048575 RepID=UPI002AB49A0E|nr:hypothetical protein [Sphingomonas sp. 10B4]MDY7525512.1 hypothetical protein [Sphingomonas sp. 10B4]MEB0281458.1 hypothetical protein [Sphingomonas sp. 10B4]